MTSRGYIDFNCDCWCAFCGRRAPKGQEKHDGLTRALKYVRIGLKDTLRQVERGSGVSWERNIV